ncbi:MAG: histidinol-phosphatase HisJ family protein [Lachnospiraceae bacterium]|nr:histidinol-phosphatase HisJ family protein [Lachnospiraceae bacterium]
MIISDCHLHSSFSSDSDAPLESMVQQAIHRNLKAICMTEHLDYDYPDNPEHLSFLLDFDAYKEKLFYLKEKYADQIELLFGIEMGLMDYLGTRYKKVADAYPFDFIIGSSHLVNGIDPYEPEYFREHGVFKGMQLYFESILNNIESCTELDYQVYGHLDYAIRYAPDKNTSFRFSDYQDIIEEILKRLIRKDKGIEVNSTGLRYGLGQPNPHFDILKCYHDMGGEILTIGSDAHKPEHMAYAFDEISTILRRAGFQHYTLFRGRQPYDIPLI